MTYHSQRPTSSFVRRRLFAFVLTLAIAATSHLAAQTPLESAFTYQGRLKDASIPASGLYDFSFSLFDAATGGIQIGTTNSISAVTMTDGLFVVELDFGAAAFVGDRAWLEVSVAPNGSPLVLLTPRQELTPSPNARFSQYSSVANFATSTFDADQLDGMDSTAFAAAGHAHSSLDAADGSPTNVVSVNNDGEINLGGLVNLAGGSSLSDTGSVIGLAGSNTASRLDVEVDGTDVALKAAPDVVGSNANDLTLAGGTVTTDDGEGGDIFLEPGTGSGLSRDGRVYVGSDLFLENGAYLSDTGAIVSLNGAIAGSSLDVYLVGTNVSVQVSPNAVNSNANSLFLSAADVNSGNGAGGSIVLEPGDGSGTGPDGQVVLRAATQVGPNGTAISNILLGGGTLDFPNTAGQSTSQLTITVAGAKVGDSVALGIPPAAMSAFGSYTAWVSSANTVAIRFANPTATPQDPTSAQFQATVFSY